MGGGRPMGGGGGGLNCGMPGRGGGLNCGMPGRGGGMGTSGTASIRTSGTAPIGTIGTRASGLCIGATGGFGAESGGGPQLAWPRTLHRRQ